MTTNKLAIISGKDPTFSEDTDGANVLVRNLASYYARQGTEVDIFTPIGYSGHQTVPKKTGPRAKDCEILEEGICVKRFPVPKMVTPHLTDTQGLNFMNRVMISMAEAAYFEDGKLDDYMRVHIIHMAHAFGLVLGDIVPIQKTIIHPMMLGREYERYTPVAPSYIEFEREVFRHGLLAQVPSHDEKTTLEKEYGVDEEQIIINPRGFNPDTLHPKIRSKPGKGIIKILCANMIRPQKGQDLFIAFAKECRRRGIPAKILLMGVNGNSYSPAYNQYANGINTAIEKEGLREYFGFLKPGRQENLNTVMQAADFAIYPSRFETFGKAPLESMATGLPTIVFDDVPAFREFLTDNETGLFVPRDPDALVDAIERCLKEEGLYETISRRGIEAGLNFHWEIVLKEMTNDINDRLQHALST